MKQTQSLTEQVITGSIVVVLLTVLSSPLGYGIRIIMSRSLSTEEFGLVYAILGLIGFFSAYSDFGFGKAATYYIPRFVAQGKKLEAWLSFLYSFGMGLLIAIPIAGLFLFGRFELSSLYFKTPIAQDILPIFGLFFLLECIALEFKNLFIGYQLVGFHSSQQPVRFTLTFILCALLFFTGNATLSSLTIAWVVGYAVSIAVFAVTFVTMHRAKMFGFTWNSELFRSLRGYALPNIVSGVLHQLNTYADTIFLTLIRGVSAVGVYNIVFPVVTLPSIILSPLTRVFFPVVASLNDSADGLNKLQLFVITIYKLIPLISLYFGVFIFLFARSAILTLFTGKWVDLAEQPLQLISITYLGFTMVSFLNLIIEAMGLLKQKIKISSALFTLNLALNPVLIYFFGVYGLILANGILQLLFVLLYTRLLKRTLLFSIPVGLYGVYIGFFSIIIGVVKLSGYWPQTLISFLITGGIYTIVVGLFASRLNIFDPHTIAILKQKFVRIQYLQDLWPLSSKQ